MTARLETGGWRPETGDRRPEAGDRRSTAQGADEAVEDLAGFLTGGVQMPMRFVVEIPQPSGKGDLILQFSRGAVGHIQKTQIISL